MQKSVNTKQQTERLVLIALLTALTAVLTYLSTVMPPIGVATINLSLVPVVVGGALMGPLVGLWLGFVSGAILFTNPGYLQYFFDINTLGTIVTILVKGSLAGLAAGFAYKLIQKKNRYIAVITSSIVCPIVNTGLYIAGCFIFLLGGEKGLAAQASGAGMSIFMFIIAGVYINFIVELILNIFLGSSIFRVVNIFKGKEIE